MTKLLASGKGINPRLELTLSTALRENLEADDFVQSIHGRILVQKDPEASEQMVGYVSASLLQLGNALEHGVNADQLGDGISGDIAEYWELLFDPETGRWRDDLQTEFEIDRTDLLIVDCIELQQGLRGLGNWIVGRRACHRALRRRLWPGGLQTVAAAIHSGVRNERAKTRPIETVSDGPRHIRAKAQNILVKSRFLASR